MDYHQPYLLKIIIFLALGATILFQPARAFEHVRISPEMSVSLPQPLQLGAEITCLKDSFFCNEKMHYFMNSGVFIFPFKLSERSLSLFNVEIGARRQISEGPLYFSSSLGIRNFFIKNNFNSFKIDDDASPSSFQMQLSALYFSPAIGMSFSLSKRLNIGFDLGAQIPLIAWGEMNLVDPSTSSSPEILAMNSKQASQWLSGTLLPRLTFFRLTMLME